MGKKISDSFLDKCFNDISSEIFVEINKSNSLSESVTRKRSTIQEETIPNFPQIPAKRTPQQEANTNKRKGVFNQSPMKKKNKFEFEDWEGFNNLIEDNSSNESIEMIPDTPPVPDDSSKKKMSLQQSRIPVLTQKKNTLN